MVHTLGYSPWDRAILDIPDISDDEVRRKIRDTLFAQNPRNHRFARKTLGWSTISATLLGFHRLENGTPPCITSGTATRVSLLITFNPVCRKEAALGGVSRLFSQDVKEWDRTLRVVP